MATPTEARERASSTYNAAADTYDSKALSFWDYFGKQTVTHLQLGAGHHVLDVASGSGASALPAADAVGQNGKVVAVDLAAKLLKLAQAKATRRNLQNIRFEVGDMMALDYPPETF